MSGFKNNVSDGWLFTQELRLFGNFMRNWNHDVEDCDFFDIFANGNNSNRDEMKILLKRHYLPKTTRDRYPTFRLARALTRRFVQSGMRSR